MNNKNTEIIVLLGLGQATKLKIETTYARHGYHCKKTKI